MPNLTMFIQAEKMPPDGVLQDLTVQCTGLCMDTLMAERKNIHIIYVAVLLGCGHPVFAEIKYRLTSFRTQSVMDDFMAGLDEAITHHTGLTARIRCLGDALPNLHARN